MVRRLVARGGSLVAVMGVISTPWIGAQMASCPSPPPLYPAAVASIVLFLVVGSARAAVGALVERHVRAAVLRRTRSTAVHLQELALVAHEGAEVGTSVAVFRDSLAGALALPRGGVRVELACTGSMPSPAEAATVAESPARYDARSTWVPLVAENAEIGRVALTGDASLQLDDVQRATSTLLCALLALLVRNAQHRERLAAQAAELDAVRRRLESETRVVRAMVRRPETFREMVGASEALHEVLALIERTAPSDVSMLVTGETGTGKELAGRAVHTLSARVDGPLITVNCPAIPGPLAESELFGHERGAFTDAIAARPGQFELAHGGTIFLDEVADLPLDIQAKLLRVLQEGEVRRVGGHRPRPVDVRTVAATNRDLRALVREGRFREDLYYRLAAVEISMPPLRARHGDVPMLATFFLDRAAESYGRRFTGFTPEAITTLCGYPWPGNVRQLQNVVQRAALLCAGDVIRPGDLAEISAAEGEHPARFGDSIRHEKKRRFIEALHQSRWNQSAAARLLGMSRSNFARMMRSLGIVVPPREMR